MTALHFEVPDRDADPIEFTIDYRKAGKAVTGIFHARRQEHVTFSIVDAQVAMDVAQAKLDGDGVRDAMVRFFKVAIIEADQARFFHLLFGDANEVGEVDPGTIGNIVRGLSRVYAQRPTMPSSVSAPGRQTRTTKATSKARPRSKASGSTKKPARGG